MAIEVVVELDDGALVVVVSEVEVVVGMLVLTCGAVEVVDTVVEVVTGPPIPAQAVRAMIGRIRIAGY